VQLYSNIGLAQVNEGRDEKNGVRVQIANPNLIVENKALEKSMDGNPKAPFEKSIKNKNLTGAGVGVVLTLANTT